MPYVLDTNIFNWLLDGWIRPGELPTDADYVSTHVQVDEINKTANADRRAALFLQFAEMRPKIVPTGSMVWNVSCWDQTKLGDGNLFEKLRSALIGTSSKVWVAPL